MPADPLGVRTACLRTLEEAEDVTLGELDGILAAVAGLDVPAWDRRRHYDGDRMIEYVLVLSTLNFSFWGSGRGYWQLAESLRDAFGAGRPLWEVEYLEGITEAQLSEVIGEFPIMDRRVAALKELGRLARTDFRGDLRLLVGASAVGLARLLSTRLPSYADVVLHRGLRVPFLKRAQIAAADLWGAGVAKYPDLADLTCFADYKLPQVLRQAGALVYSDRLARRVDDWRELKPGEPAEVEIRAGTVIAVESLRDALFARGRDLMAIEVDWILWKHSQGLFPVRPYHRTRTVFY